MDAIQYLVLNGYKIVLLYWMYRHSCTSSLLSDHVPRTIIHSTRGVLERNRAGVSLSIGRLSRLLQPFVTFRECFYVQYPDDTLDCSFKITHDHRQTFPCY